MTEYDIAKILDEMELEIIKSMKLHLSEGMTLDAMQWRDLQLYEFRKFRKENRKIINKYLKAVDEDTETFLKEEFKKNLDSKINDISKRSHGRIKAKITDREAIGELYAISDARLVSMLDAVKNDINNKIFSLYRRDEDVYRQTIFKASTLVNAGTVGLVKAINIAQDDYLDKGVTDCLYKNGMRMPIRSYAEMALRTNAMRTASQSRGLVCDYLGINTVMISRHQSSCPACGVWEGRIVIDDVYCTVSDEEAKSSIYPRLSQVIASGYKHPNCRHTETEIDPEIDDDYKPKTYTKSDKERYEAEQKQREIEREIRKIKRKLVGTVGMSPELKAKEQELLNHLEANPLLKRKKWRESP